MKNFVVLFLIAISTNTIGQTYDSYFTGNPIDIVTSPLGGVCLMGGASESDDAMIWFLEQADGGDVLVLRASGSDGYNDYLYSDLGVAVNSVETIVFNDAAASVETYIHDRIAQAEAIWFAGGDQWNYISFWRNTTIQHLINSAIAERNIVVGGTSAGMAILGEYYFSAENGTITSTSALNNPYTTNATVDSTPFLDIPFMENVITDTHYDNPDRRGRHVSFMARMMTDYLVSPKGIASEEYTAVCVDADGLARVYGDYPDYDDFAYFIKPNCQLADASPETCSPSTLLTWSHNNSALDVIKIPGTTTGEYFIDLNDWQTTNANTWEKWYVNNANFGTVVSTAPDCSNAVVEDYVVITGGPNPTSDWFSVASDQAINLIECYNLSGEMIFSTQAQLFSTRGLTSGYYILQVHTSNRVKRLPILKID